MNENQKERNTNRASDDTPEESRQGKRSGGLTPSTAPNNSFDSGAGDENTGFDSPPVASSTLSNTEVHDADPDEFPDELEDDLGDSGK